MAAFKQFNSQDIIISPLEVAKGFSFPNGTALTASNVQIERYRGGKGSSETTGINYLLTQSLVYDSAAQLYYSNYLSSSNGEVQPANTASYTPDGVIHGLVDSNAYENFETTDLNPYKYFPTASYSALVATSDRYSIGKYGIARYEMKQIEVSIGVISIPKNLYGDQIQPGSLKISTPSGSLFDDGEGRLKRETPFNTGSIFVGNVVYEHGIIIFTGGNRSDATGEFSKYGQAEYGNGIYGGRTIGENDIENFITTEDIVIDFSSSFTIYETQYKSTIGQDEFNYSQNPSTLKYSYNDGVPYDFVTGSYFSPYVTTVGMYNESNELLAVGKLAQPLPTSRTTDTTILVNIDRQ